ncbi:DUF563 domain-containing protein [Heliobacillus mobilis]|uniref:DUF563 domain-containing protein n=1 Tax=Heliobacterium mobile TaxID=28064 RepID=A0A6I3SPE0_HELMO|nr:glycosyltransferase family 61 protein [Heliobacterium mobile]MTV50382.1 DUF563 domain-containing protein [Heliobacterium mobile]
MDKQNFDRNCLCLHFDIPFARTFFGDYFNDKQFITVSWKGTAHIQLHEECYSIDDIKNRFPDGWVPDMIFVWKPEDHANPLGLFIENIPILAFICHWDRGGSAFIEHLGDYDWIFTVNQGKRVLKKFGLQHVSALPMHKLKGAFELRKSGDTVDDDEEEEFQNMVRDGERKTDSKKNDEEPVRLIVNLLTKNPLFSQQGRVDRTDSSKSIRGQALQIYNASYGAIGKMLNEFFQKHCDDSDSWWLNARGCVKMLASADENVPETERFLSFQSALEDWENAAKIDDYYFLPLFNWFSALVLTENYRMALDEFDYIRKYCSLGRNHSFDGFILPREEDGSAERHSIEVRCFREIMGQSYLITNFLSELYELKGKAHIALGELSSAVEAFDISVTYRATNIRSRYLLALVLRKEEKNHDAVEHLKLLLEYDPFYFDGVVTLCETYQSAGKWEASRELALHYLNVIETMPEYDGWATRLTDFLSVSPKNSIGITGLMSTKAWIDIQIAKHRPENEILTIVPSEEIKRTLPGKAGEEVHWIFRDRETFTSPECFVATIPEGKVYGTIGAVITPDQRLLIDVSNMFNFPPERHPLLTIGRFPPPQKIDGTVAVVSAAGWWNYYHWMFDILPRFELLRRSGIVIDKYIIKTNVLDFQRESLQSLGISEEKVISPDDNAYYCAEKLVVPSLPSVVDNMTKWVCDFLRSKFLPQNLGEEPHRLLYISRERAQWRRLINEPEIIQFLQRLRFDVVYLEGMSVADQARLFSQAKVIVAPHGAGLSNLVFSSPGVTVLELFGPTYVNTMFWALSNIMDHKYHHLIGEGEQASRDIDPFTTENYRDDFVVNMDNLKSVIDTLGL